MSYYSLYVTHFILFRSVRFSLIFTELHKILNSSYLYKYSYITAYSIHDYLLINIMLVHSFYYIHFYTKNSVAEVVSLYSINVKF